MGNLDWLWLVLAGIGGGLSGSIAGLASLVTYPALLAVGLSPVTANVTNTVALVFSTVGSTIGSRPELRGQAAPIRQLGAISVAGGIAGGIVLLTTPPGSFALVVPWLIGLAALAILITRNKAPVGSQLTHAPRWLLLGGVFAIGVYGGYFGAASGVLMLALLLARIGEPLARTNALKNLLIGMANAIAAVAFVFFGSVHWASVLPLACGLFVGGRVGPVVVRRAPTRPLRILIACGGLGLAVHLGLDAYH